MLAPRGVDPLVPVGVIAAGAMAAVGVGVNVVGRLAVGPLESVAGPDLRVLGLEARDLVDLIADADKESGGVRDRGPGLAGPGRLAGLAGGVDRGRHVRC